ncbi:MAG: hypothetical protein QGD94_03405, partial [Planctomycetia bacterium]|nr:hypothetical protein [Planctomycetia bacterium]
MLMRNTALVLFLTVCSVAPVEAVKRVPVTADVGICAHPKEVLLNTGGRSHIRIKGNEHYYLFTFDAKPLRHWKIESATLHLKLARGRLSRVALSSVPVAWVEGTATGEPQKGSSCFTHAKYPDTAWTPGGGNMMDATFNSPYMMWRTSEVTYDGKWMKIPIAPELVQAVVNGLSHGLVLGEEKGQTRQNHDVFTREQANAKPYLIIEAEPWHVLGLMKRPEFKAESYPAAADFKTGAIKINTAWPGKSDQVVGSRIKVFPAKPGLPRPAPVKTLVTLGDPDVVVEGLQPGKEYVVTVETFIGPQPYRYSIPFKGKKVMVEVKASAALALPVVPELKPPEVLKGTLNAETGWVLELYPPMAKLPPNVKFSHPTPTILVPPATRNAWVGLQAVIFPPNGNAQDITIELTHPYHTGGVWGKAPALPKVNLYRTWYVPDVSGYHAETLVPLNGVEKFAIPWKKNKVPRQRNQQIFIDIWVPKHAFPGPYENNLIVKQGGKEVVSAKIKLQVANVTLPDEFNIIGDMNTYSSPARALGIRESDPKAFMEAERRYYRLAHAHRMT